MTLVDSCHWEMERERCRQGQSLGVGHTQLKEGIWAERHSLHRASSGMVLLLEMAGVRQPSNKESVQSTKVQRSQMYRRWFPGDSVQGKNHPA